MYNVQYFYTILIIQLIIKPPQFAAPFLSLNQNLPIIIPKLFFYSKYNSISCTASMFYENVSMLIDNLKHKTNFCSVFE